MDTSAHVSALAALTDFRDDLCVFNDRAKDSLITLSMEVRHAFHWLDQQQRHWEAAVRQAENDVFQAKNELARRKMMRISDRPPDTTEQEEAYALARAKLEHAEEKLANCRRWQRQLPEEVHEYEGPARQLQGLLEGHLPRAISYMEHKIGWLEDYLREGKV